MKATLDIPDELCRRVKARSALEGRPIRSVASSFSKTGSLPPPHKQPIERKIT